MKQIFVILFALIAVGASAQSDKYAAAMEKNLAMFDSARTTEAFQSLAAAFERIGDAEKNQWLPYYYAGLALTISAWTDTRVDKDANAERIKTLCDKADALTNENSDKSEILAIRNMAATQQMLVDPQNRYMTYGQEGAGYLAKAKELDPNNPRLAYLEGAGIFGTPEQFGGGKAKAKPVLEKAVALFQAAHPKALYPRWGQPQAEDMLKQCQ
jgi:hypothetical protein